MIGALSRTRFLATTRTGISKEERARLQRQTTQTHANDMAQYELEQGGPAAAARLARWLSGATMYGRRTLAGSAEV